MAVIGGYPHDGRVSWTCVDEGKPKKHRNHVPDFEDDLQQLGD